jgi:hypothetical protein
MKHVELSLADIREVTKALEEHRRVAVGDFGKADRLFRLFQRAENVTLQVNRDSMSTAGNLGERRSGQGAAR